MLIYYFRQHNFSVFSYFIITAFLTFTVTPTSGPQLLSAEKQTLDLFLRVLIEHYCPSLWVSFSHKTPFFPAAPPPLFPPSSSILLLPLSVSALCSHRRPLHLSHSSKTHSQPDGETERRPDAKIQTCILNYNPLSVDLRLHHQYVRTGRRGRIHIHVTLSASLRGAVQGKAPPHFKVSLSLKCLANRSQHSRAEQSDPLCQPIGNEFGAWPVSHDSVFYGPG